MSQKVLVLGAGMVGTHIAEDLAAEAGFEVLLADRDAAALARAKARCGAIGTLEADLADPERVTALAEAADVVCGALSSRIGLQTLRAVVRTGRPYADIAFMPEDAQELDALAKEHGSVAVMDCGVAPGMSNLLAGWGVARLDRATRLEVLVGGLPVVRSKPWEYKAGFAPSDVLEEYTRPSRIVQGGEVVVREALSDPVDYEFEGIGTLEGPITDGLRSLVDLPIPEMVERTLRYPGHSALMRTLREGGFFSTEPIRVGDQELTPLEMTSAMLFPKWKFLPGEEDLTVMRITIEGERAGGRERIVWDLHAPYDRERGITSMARSTSIPCALVARILARGAYAEPGVHAPEALGDRTDLVEEILAGHEARGLHYKERVEAL